MNSDKKQKPSWWGKSIVFIMSQGISLLGSQIVQMAMIWYVTLETSSGIWITVLTLASFLPQMLMLLFGGVWADRYNRKQIIIISDLMIAVSTLLLALFIKFGNTGNAALSAIIVVSAIRSVGSGIQTPAVNAIIPQFVPKEGLMHVNGINGSVQSIVQFVSPIAAGAIMSVGPIYHIMFLDVVTAVIGISILIFIKIPQYYSEEKKKSASIFTEMKEGLQFTWNHKFLKKILITYGMYIFLCVPSGFLTALMIERTFGNQVIFLTVNETVGFAGALLGGLLLGITGGFKNRNKTFFVGIIIYGLASLAVGFTDTFWIFTVFMFFIGITIPVAQTTVFTLVQEKADTSMHGRVFSLVNIMFTGFMMTGMAVFGPLADILSIQSMVILCGVFMIFLGLSVLLPRSFYRDGMVIES